MSAEGRQSVEAIYRADPFWMAGLRRSVKVSHWAKAFWSPAFREAMQTLGVP